MKSFDEQLAECAQEARAQAELLPAGQLRDKLIEKARQYEVQIAMHGLWPSASAR